MAWATGVLLVHGQHVGRHDAAGRLLPVLEELLDVLGLVLLHEVEDLLGLLVGQLVDDLGGVVGRHAGRGCRRSPPRRGRGGASAGAGRPARTGRGPPARSMRRRKTATCSATGRSRSAAAMSAGWVPSSGCAEALAAARLEQLAERLGDAAVVHGGARPAPRQWGVGRSGLARRRGVGRADGRGRPAGPAPGSGGARAGECASGASSCWTMPTRPARIRPTTMDRRMTSGQRARPRFAR